MLTWRPSHRRVFPLYCISPSPTLPSLALFFTPQTLPCHVSTSVVCAEGYRGGGGQGERGGRQMNQPAGGQINTVVVREEAERRRYGLQPSEKQTETSAATVFIFSAALSLLNFPKITLELRLKIFHRCVFLQQRRYCCRFTCQPGAQMRTNQGVVTWLNCETCEGNLFFAFSSVKTAQRVKRRPAASSCSSESFSVHSAQQTQQDDLL